MTTIDKEQRAYENLALLRQELPGYIQVLTNEAHYKFLDDSTSPRPNTIEMPLDITNNFTFSKKHPTQEQTAAFQILELASLAYIYNNTSFINKEHMLNVAEREYEFRKDRPDQKRTKIRSTIPISNINVDTKMLKIQSPDTDLLCEIYLTRDALVNDALGKNAEHVHAHHDSVSKKIRGEAEERLGKIFIYEAAELFILFEDSAVEESAKRWQTLKEHANMDARESKTLAKTIEGLGH